MDLFYSKPFRIEVLVSITQDRIKSGREASSPTATGVAVATAASATVAEAAVGVKGQTSESDTPPLHVLIATDSLPIMKLMTRNLSRAKHLVDQAVNGLIGLECMKQKEFDVVVMDLQVRAFVLLFLFRCRL